MTRIRDIEVMTTLKCTRQVIGDTLTKLRVKMFKKLHRYLAVYPCTTSAVTSDLCAKRPSIHGAHQDLHLLGDSHQRRIHRVISVVGDGAKDGASRKTGPFDGMVGRPDAVNLSIWREVRHLLIAYVIASRSTCRHHR